MLPYRLTLVGSFGLWLILGAACSDEKSRLDDTSADEANASSGDLLTPDEPGSSTDPMGSVTATGISLPQTVTMTATGTVMCGNSPCECNNGVDDDGDGTVDGFDIECTGAIDNDEGSFATGIPGDNRDPKWQDCFFDGNSGHGDDRCRYPTECLTGELSLDDEACAVTQQCRDNCQPRTPNGCDCFGCCAVPVPGGGTVNVLLTDSCSAEKIGDTEACPVCVPSTECVAEPPPGEPEEPSPPDAGNPDPTDPGCNGRAECDAKGGCEIGEFCSQGCCLVIIE